MKHAISKQLFVYSSLRKGFHKASHHYIAKYFSFISNAKVKGVVTDVKGELFATPGNGSSFIEGELYQLNSSDDFSFVFGQLDEYEGLVVEQGEKPLYRRELIRVYKDGGEIIDAWIYWFNDDVSFNSVGI